MCRGCSIPCTPAPLDTPSSFFAIGDILFTLLFCFVHSYPSIVLNKMRFRNYDWNHIGGGGEYVEYFVAFKGRGGKQKFMFGKRNLHVQSCRCITLHKRKFEVTYFLMIFLLNMKKSRGINGEITWSCFNGMYNVYLLWFFFPMIAQREM